MATVLQLIEKHGGSRRKHSAYDQVKRLQTVLGEELPEDYCSYLAQFHGFENFIGEEYVVLWPVEEIESANEDSLIKNSLANTIGIGGNGGGEYLAIEKVGSKGCKIVLSPLIDLSSEHHITVGQSFTDFIERLDTGQGWFKQN